MEPLDSEEFELRQNLNNYPTLLCQYLPDFVQLTELVPRIIARIIASRQPDANFEQLTGVFRNYDYPEIKQKYKDYVDLLKDKAEFYRLRRQLFLEGYPMELYVCDGAYRERGLFITMKNGLLRFYNSMARNILFDTFSTVFSVKIILLNYQTVSERRKE
ncbi:hypothetical protein Gasu2_06200 [Galdieria sulphuraria]|nr:hypothetical protein Gasu2_06200 [Galdieria sulphuraria]